MCFLFLNYSSLIYVQVSIGLGPSQVHLIYFVLYVAERYL